MKSNPAVLPTTPERYCADSRSESLNRPFRASSRSTLSWVHSSAVRLPSGVRLSCSFFRPVTTLFQVRAWPTLFTC